MKKYKAWDKVLVRKDLQYITYISPYWGGDVVTEEMYNKRWKFVTIIKCYSDWTYKIEEDGWNWIDTMFEDGGNYERNDYIFDF